MVNLVSYTGSGAVGEGVMKQAAAGLKPVALELGGKGAIVVFEDAPIEATVDWIMCGIFICAGQVCSATSRLIVQEGVQLGPMCSLDQQRQVVAMIEKCKAGGAKILC